MAPQNSSSSHGSRGRFLQGPNQQMMCYHKEVACLRTVKVQGPTFGKRFYGCSHWPRTCGFFKWADEVDEIGELHYKLFELDVTIDGLELEKQRLQEDVKELRKKNFELEDQVTELCIENCVKYEAMENVKADKKLVMLLFLSWFFFAVVWMFFK